ncbi:acyl-CoA dehydrogenase family protein [Streptomyces poriferorum]|uniref:Acyl-CoA dehydrogenase family protein n=1 Tax=Streptomyces poriferorum TaxID=2798799 RepID=A0ABY9IFP4_9ACTN|nr:MULTISPECIES: acyl-CoA dehydrogenase family protein [unclassified Streptomyces]MDP5315649.1 acyl-CoA dehydrogenase family protein [Streptomyces sp. Alt4]WLQ54018.1 acyl-CoA dehydrogenase family protein [Streptomyces sp. Alt2]
MLTAGPPATRCLTEVPTALIQIARRDAPLVEERRKLTDDLAEAITRAGFARHFVPCRWGGDAGDFTSLLRSTASVAEACASTAWCAALYAAHARLAAYLPEEAQHDLWASTPDVRIAASVVPPQGTATAVPDGWSLSGRWSFASGLAHADWVLLASWTQSAPCSDHPEGQREHRIFAVPRAHLTSVDTWHTLGLRGTGSNSVQANEVYVPAYRSLLLTDLISPLAGGARCHAVPFPMVAGLQFAAPILGAARGAMHAWVSSTREREWSGSQQVESAKFQQALARSSGEIQAAQLLLEQAAHRADHEMPTALNTAENQRNAAMAAEWCASAVDRLFRVQGVRSQAAGDPVQRHWRDVTAAAGHATLGFEIAATAHAQAVFTQITQPGG